MFLQQQINFVQTMKNFFILLIKFFLLNLVIKSNILLILIKKRFFTKEFWTQDLIINSSIIW